MSGGVEWSGAAHSLVQLFIYRYLQVDDPVTPLAYEVVVRFGIRLEPVECTAELPLRYQPLLHEYVEVAVDGAHAQVGELVFQLLIQPGCSRMPACVSEQFEYLLTLGAVVVTLLCGDLFILKLKFGTILNFNSYHAIVNTF